MSRGMTYPARCWTLDTLCLRLARLAEPVRRERANCCGLPSPDGGHWLYHYDDGTIVYDGYRIETYGARATSVFARAKEIHRQMWSEEARAKREERERRRGKHDPLLRNGENLLFRLRYTYPVVAREWRRRRARIAAAKKGAITRKMRRLQPETLNAIRSVARYSVEVPCPRCGGSGVYYGRRSEGECWHCDGDGTVLRERLDDDYLREMVSSTDVTPQTTPDEVRDWFAPAPDVISEEAYDASHDEDGNFRGSLYREIVAESAEESGKSEEEVEAEARRIGSL